MEPLGVDHSNGVLFVSNIARLGLISVRSGAVPPKIMIRPSGAMKDIYF